MAGGTGPSCVYQPIPTQPNRRGRPSRTTGQVADAHLNRHGPPSEAVVVAVTNGRLDFGTWERIFQSQAGGLARES